MEEGSLIAANLTRKADSNQFVVPFPPCIHDRINSFRLLSISVFLKFSQSSILNLTALQPRSLVAFVEMELATRTFDLARAFADISLNGNSIANATTELARWMARECILESEFGYFQNLARGVTFPNDSGLRIRHMLLEAIPKFKKIGGLHLLNSGSIGRMLAFDPEYCYMVSTVSVLLAYHDIPFAASVLCNMALDHGVDRQEKANVNSYDIRRTRLRPVMDKVVQSIALNVVNSGHDLRGLPFDFENNCIHCLQDTTLSAAIMAIERTEGDVLVRCDHFLADLFVWLLNHWQGMAAVY